MDRAVGYSYDPNGELSDVTDLGGGVTHYTYDANHLMQTITHPANPDGERGITTNHYDANWRVDWQTDTPTLTTTRRTDFTYAPDKTTVTSPEGRVTVENYTLGVLSSITRGFGTPQAAT
jgi:YD repeat-containing protein